MITIDKNAILIEGNDPCFSVPKIVWKLSGNNYKIEEFWFMIVDDNKKENYKTKFRFKCLQKEELDNLI